ncbi:integrase, catalytic region, zinc finger, CCHC-type containing protein [Tanacetum coccineum]
MLLPEAKTGQNENQRAVVVARNRETVGRRVVQQTGIKCYKCNGFGHVAKECSSATRIDSDGEPEDHELEAYYIYMAKIQEVLPETTEDTAPSYDTGPLQKIVQIILIIVDSGCTKHLTGNLKLLINFV